MLTLIGFITLRGFVHDGWRLMFGLTLLTIVILIARLLPRKTR